MKKIASGIMILLTVALVGCTGKSNITESEKITDVTNPAEELADDTNPGEELVDVAIPEDGSVSEVTDKMLIEKYADYVIDEAKKNPGQNVVFSPESMNIAFALYSNLLTQSDKQALNACLNKDYLSFRSNDTFKIINRIWVNKNKGVNIDKIPAHDEIYEMDMTDSGKATEFKNDFVAENTSGFIKSTPTQLNNNTVFDVMNIIYFKDTWAFGNKTSLEEPFEFTGADGSVQFVPAFCDYGGTVTRSQEDNAYSYRMQYNNGFTYNIILPDKNIDIDEINIGSFIKGETEIKNAKTSLIMPEYEADCTFFIDSGITQNQFKIPFPNIDPEIYNEKISSIISQVAKVKVDKEGTEAAAVTEVMPVTMCLPPKEQDLEKIIIECDRPFLFYIEDNTNNDIAFIGVVNRP